MNRKVTAGCLLFFLALPFLSSATILFPNTISASAAYRGTEAYTIESVTRLTSKPTQYGKTEFDIQISGIFTNPYDAQEASLDMHLTSPSGKAIVLPCFFVSGNATTSLWKARFAAREAGTYSYVVKLTKANGPAAASASAQFTAEETAQPGFLHKKDNWTFQFDSGKPFRGTSMTIGWEGRSYENANYTYEYFLPKLASNGVDFFRTWMCVWNLPLQWKTVTSTNRYTNSEAYFHLQGIQRTDELVRMSDSLGLHMMLTFDWHGALQTGGEWKLNPYNTANGGPAATPTEFFTSPVAKAHYKNKLRFLVARWGYSPSIGAWEFFNEVDNAAYNGTESTIAIPHSTITDWHDEMAKYLKSIDPYNHLVTTSISHRPISGMNTLSSLDFNQTHIYNNTSGIPNAITNSISNYGKPFVVGEYAYDWNWDNINTANGENLDYDLKRGLWYGLFSSTPILPMSWWWEFFDGRGMFPYFKGVREISARMLLAGKGAFAPATTTVSGWEAYGVKCGSQHFAYVLNNTTTNGEKTFSINVGTNGAFTVQRFNPADRSYTSLGKFTSVANMLSIPSLSLNSKKELVLVIVPDGNTEGVRAPYTGSVLPIPGKIEAEDFDKGGEGVAYHDLDATNTGGQYRTTEGVDIAQFAGSQYYLKDLVSGEWTTYSVHVQKAGVYTLEVQVAATEAGRSFHLELDGKNISGLIAVPNTGGEEVWQTVSLRTTELTAGDKLLRLVCDATGFGIHSLAFTLYNQAPSVAITSPVEGSSVELPGTVTFTADATDADGTVAKVEFFQGMVKLGEDTEAPYSYTWSPKQGSHAITAKAIDEKGLAATSAILNITVIPSQTQTPYTGTAYAIPGKIEAENYDQGAPEVAYHDLSPTNTAGQYRTAEGVDIEACTDEGGGYSLGNNQTGEWVEYTVNVTQTGFYDIAFRVATQQSGQAMHMEVDGVNVTDRLNVPNTGGWQTWKTLTKARVSLTKGQRILRVTFDSEYFNLNHLTFSPAANVAPTVSLSAPSPNAQMAPGTNAIITANAADVDGTVAKVEFYVNENKVGEATAAPYTFAWNNVALGTYDLKAKAFDEKGLATESAVVKVTVAAIMALEEEDARETTLSPNPTQTQFTLTLPLAAKSVQVLTMQGQEVYRKEGSSFTEASFGDSLDTGVYILLIQFQNGTKEIRKAIKFQ